MAVEKEVADLGSIAEKLRGRWVVVVGSGQRTQAEGLGCKREEVRPSSRC